MLQNQYKLWYCPWILHQSNYMLKYYTHNFLNLYHNTYQPTYIKLLFVCIFTLTIGKAIVSISTSFITFFTKKSWLAITSSIRKAIGICSIGQATLTIIHAISTFISFVTITCSKNAVTIIITFNWTKTWRN